MTLPVCNHCRKRPRADAIVWCEPCWWQVAPNLRKWLLAARRYTEERLRRQHVIAEHLKLIREVG